MESSPVIANPNVSGSPKTGILVALAIIAISLGAIWYFLFLPSYKTNQILENGLQAEGVIKAIEPTGSYYNSQPEARITIEAHATSTAGKGTTFTTYARKVINPIYAPQFQPGRRVLIRYLPEDPSKAAVEFVEGS